MEAGAKYLNFAPDFNRFREQLNLETALVEDREIIDGAHK